jgi:hypothetical protein
VTVRSRPYTSSVHRYLTRLYRYGGRSPHPEAQGFEPSVTDRMLEQGLLERVAAHGVAVTDAGLAFINKSRDQLTAAVARWSRHK